MENKELQTTTKLVSLATLQPDVLGRELAVVRTLNDALAVSSDRSKYPSLAVLRREYGEAKIEAIIKLHLIDLCENVNLKRPLRDRQVDGIAREIVSEFYALTIADIHVVFRQAKTGQYGEFYDSLDMPKVMGWFRQYFADRCAACADESVSGQFYDKGGNLTPDRMAKEFESLTKKMTRR